MRFIFGVFLISQWFLVPSANGACEFFMFHSGANVRTAEPCSLEALGKDTDSDGKKDWKFNSLFGSFLFPSDQDWDGDHIPNLLDPDPFHASKQKVNLRQFPKHLLTSKSHEVKNLQIELHRIAGIFAIAQSEQMRPEIINALLRIYRSPIGPRLAQRISKLKTISTVKNLHQRGATGLYLEPGDAIVLKANIADQNPHYLLKTIAHEIGHAALFSMETASSFAGTASNQGGWQISESNSLYDPVFLRRFHGVSSVPKSFPSNYAYANSHEWFAENFAHFILDALGEENKLSQSMKIYFNSLIAL